MKKLWHSTTRRDLIVVTLFGLVLTTPLWMTTAVTCTHDGHLHYHRIATLNHAWQNGLYFTRWLPDLAFGYGYPFFIYREAPPLAIPFVLHLFNIPLPAAENMAYALWLLSAGWFMYLWVRDVFGRRSGIVSAVAYMTAPYLLIDTLIRGNSPEALALPLFPLILWSARRYFINHQSLITPHYLIAIFSLALLSLSHNISTFIFAPTLLVYLIGLAVMDKMRWQTAVTRIVLLFLLAFGMTIFYTGGALLELNQVTLEQSTNSRNNDFRYNYASIAEIMAPVTPEDPNLVNPPLLFRLGWVPVGLAIVGLATLLWRSRKRRKPNAQHLLPNRHSQEQIGHVILMTIAALLYLLLTLPISLPFWETVPLIDFVQFPWRFVGRAALPLALLAGAAFTDPWSVDGQPHQSGNSQFAIRLLYYGALVLLILEALPLLYPSICSEDPFPTIDTVHRYEAETGLVGVDPEGSYFPRTVKQRPFTSPLLTDYANNQTPQRFDSTSFPAGTAVIATEYGNNQAVIQLNTPEPFTLRYLTFDFPGWTVTLNGESVPITPSDPEGLITFPVPAGEHTIEVRWRSTPLRTMLTAVSLFALVLSLVVGSWSLVTGRWSLATSYQPLATHRQSLATSHLLLLALSLLIFKLAIVDRHETIFRRAGLPDVAYSANLVANELRFAGYNLSQTAVASGGTFDIDLAWTAVAPPSARYQSNIWLEDANGLLWSDKETHRPRIYEDAPVTQTWQPGQWGWDSREVTVLSGTPPGQYNIVLTYFDYTTLQPLTLTDGATGAVIGPTAVIGQINITTPNQPPLFTPQYPTNIPLADLILLGYNQDRAGAAPGDVVLLTLFWEKPENPPGAITQFTLRLHNGDGTIRAEWPIVPTDLMPGSRWRDQELLRLPANLDSGTYTFSLNNRDLGTIAIDAPKRVFEQPEVTTAVNQTFFSPNQQPLTQLIGYNQPPASNNQLPITLIWHANAETTTSYRVFVHLLDENGRIIAQSDGEPANWTRPTTGWAANEYISDEHLLNLPANLPAGLLSLRIGLYDPATGERLSTANSDAVTIPLAP